MNQPLLLRKQINCAENNLILKTQIQNYMDDPQQPQGQQLQIELGEKEAEGIYSNLAIITHSPAEFIIDYTRVTPGVPKARVLSRIIMTPQHMKLLLGAMKENLERYEEQYGEVRI